MSNSVFLVFKNKNLLENFRGFFIEKISIKKFFFNKKISLIKIRQFLLKKILKRFQNSIRNTFFFKIKINFLYGKKLIF